MSRTPVKLAKNYKPSSREKYMNEKQLEYFRQKLLAWRQSLLDESQQTIDQMREAARDVSDEAERASREAEISFELRTRDRYRKLLSKIDQALERIEDGSYGWCEETGEPIGLGRLEARPIATLSIEAQERREQLEKQYTDRA
ncbi:MAG: RNA polymerase-binding protein DksA [Ectothiorhodospiraceae bacterium]|nr:RNA polymerase-binding protein DksA [Chromatiales bacterium]MCP5154477.1 RNA polymerase-binding protein DksA [Ectothiorhodospiraceae bacterium]